MPVTISRSFHLFAVTLVSVLFSVAYLIGSSSVCQAVEFKFAENLRIESVNNLSESFGVAGVEMSLLGRHSGAYLAGVNDGHFPHNSRMSGNFYQTGEFNPEISLFVSGRAASQPDRLNLNKPKRALSSEHNRYKNTKPAIYRLTLKGYSILEYSRYRTDTWGLNKVKNDIFRKPQIMFSFSKQF